ncbi:hypothetical protein [Caulobacter phage Cr30]|uniref:RuvC-like Holliday junction resolvase n=1 Tax=Caulobacter phage Cr30 TaxID=1357714 RepID=UPI0004A9B4FF|nr:RuvC-like Holliday junction resolvase [Caulobacter phage Cr30]AGS80926.1 hypothetical protein [Caulobacter phage Cr30]
MPKYGGVDFSYTSPGITIYDSDTDEYQHYGYTTHKKATSFKNFHLTLQKDWNSQEERFNNIVEWSMKILEGCEHVFIENYAFGGNLLATIGENTGLLKNRLYLAGIPFTVFAPSSVKKYATGKGNAKKEQLAEAFLKETGLNLKDLFNQGKNQWNPSSDIIDSYYIVKLGFTSLLE